MKLILQERGMTTKELAEAIDYHPNVVERFCRIADHDAASLIIMARVCQLLNIQPGDIFIFLPHNPADFPDIEMGEFATWLLKQKGRGDVVAGLAEEILRRLGEGDEQIPIHSNARQDWEQYLASSGLQIEIGHQAWKDWRGGSKRAKARNRVNRQERLRSFRKFVEND